MVSWITTIDRSALFAEMGLGKTIATLTGIADLISNLEVSKVLIVAPKRVALNTWSDEIEGWPHVSWLTYTQLAGLTQKQRYKAMREDTDIHIINRENLVWLIEACGTKWPYDMIVIDELSSFKSPSSKRFRRSKRIAGLIKRFVGLTGTPAPNGLLNLWSQVFLIDLGQRLGKTYTGYKNRYFFPDHMGFNWYLRDGAADTIHGKIKDVCLSMKASDYLEVPDDIVTPQYIDLPSPVREKYRQMEKEALIELEAGDIVAFQQSTVNQKLQQIANGAVYDEDKKVHIVHDEKMTALDQIIDEAQGKPVLVAYNFVSDRDRILKKYKNAVHLADDPTTVSRWNAGEIPILVAHPASCGHGLNLQHGSNILIWFGALWDLELFLQMNARIGSLRQKQSGLDRPGFIYPIIARDTIEDGVMMPRLDGKITTEQNLMKALRDNIKERITT